MTTKPVKDAIAWNGGVAEQDRDRKDGEKEEMQRRIASAASRRPLCLQSKHLYGGTLLPKH